MRTDLFRVMATSSVLFLVFASAFVDSSLSPEIRRSTTSALLSMNESPDMLKVMETKIGFQAYAVDEPAQEKKSGQLVR